MVLRSRIDAIRARKRAHWRLQRMHAFLQRVRPAPGATVLDLGGTPELWGLLDHRLDVTLLNTDEVRGWGCRPPQANRFHVVAGDACDLERFGNGSFDVVFSNSLIEHLGGDERLLRFAREVRRVGRSYWVQTPSWLFPIEAHTGLPLYWLYPTPVRGAIARRLDGRYQSFPWYCAMADTRSLSLSELRALFPDASLFTERVAGFTKSWSLYRVAEASCA
jgi:SAM-dependent methyltransferase